MLATRLVFLFVLLSLAFSMSTARGDDSGTPYESTAQVVPDIYNTRGVVDSAGGVNSAKINVDPHTGTLQIAQTDLYVPGNGGMDLEIARYYHSLQAGQEREYSPVGVGWVMTFGMIKMPYPQKMCSPVYDEYLYDNPVYEAPDGSVRVLSLGVDIAEDDETSHFVDWQNFTYITKQFDTLFCQGYQDADPLNDKIWMRRADGTRVDFTHRYLDTSVDSPATWYTNKITDPNGNWIKIFYRSSGVIGNTGLLIDYVTTSDGRRVDFTYENAAGNGPRLTALVYQGHAWTYSYEASNTNNNGTGQEDQFSLSNLTGVTTPDGDGWNYGYGDANSDAGGSITQITNPYGGVTSVEYDTDNVYLAADGQYVRNRHVILYKEADRRTVNYTYQRNESGDVTTVTDDIGVKTYYFDGLKSVSSGTVWRIGVLNKETYEPENGSKETIVYTYDRVPISREQSIRRRGLIGSLPVDSRYYLPVLTAKTVTLGQGQWATTYNYQRSDSFGNDQFYFFGPPHLMSMNQDGPSGERTLTNKYKDVSDYYLWLLPVGIGGFEEDSGEVYEKHRAYDEKGNVAASFDKGVKTEYQRDDVGNVLSATMPEGTHWNYSGYDKGSPTTVVKPSGLVIDQTVDDFGRVSRRSYEGRTESTTYDVAGRILNTTPAAGLPTDITWSSNKAVLTRGDLKHIYHFDGYGRVTAEEISGQDMTPLDIDRVFDSHDRVTTLTVNGVSVLYVYDGYGRLIGVQQGGFGRSLSYGPRTITAINELGGQTTQHIRSYAGPFSYEYLGYEQDGGVSIDIEKNKFGRITKISSGGIDRIYDYGSGYFYPLSYMEPETGRTVLGYDAQNRVVLKQFYGLGDSVGRQKTIAYDEAGNVVTETVDNGESVVTNDYDYDTLGELLSVSHKITSDDAVTDEVDSTYSYTLDGLLSSKTISLDGRQFTLDYTYDEYRNPASITYPSGNRYDIGSNPIGRPISYQGFVTSAAYSFSGQPVSIDYSNGDHYGAAINNRMVLASMSVSGANGRIIDRSYEYDGGLNLTSITDEIEPGNDLTATYDHFSRLVSASRNGNSYGYVYDPLNNLSAVSENGESYSFSYDGNNRLSASEKDPLRGYSYNRFGEAIFFGLSVSSVPVGGSIDNYHYERGGGGRISRIVKEHIRAYSSGVFVNATAKKYLYDQRGYMVRSQNQKDTYDAIKGKTETADVGAPQYYVYDGNGRLVYELDANTGFQKEYHYLGSRLIGMMSDHYSCEEGSTPFARTVLKRRTASCPEQQLYVAFGGYGTARCNRIHRPWLHPEFDIDGGRPVLA